MSPRAGNPILAMCVVSHRPCPIASLWPLLGSLPARWMVVAFSSPSRMPSSRLSGVFEFLRISFPLRVPFVFLSVGVKLTGMDDSSIAGQTEKLRREIALIQQEERSYRTHQIHSLAEHNEHDKREFRVLAIREELRTLVEKAKQQRSHGSVWYS